MNANGAGKRDKRKVNAGRLPSQKARSQPLDSEAMEILHQVEAHYLNRAESAARILMKSAGEEPEMMMEALRQRGKDHSGYSLMRDGLAHCYYAAQYGLARNRKDVLDVAITLADALLKKHATPSGGFIEWDRNSWLAPEVMWRTIPWGVAFCGSRTIETWEVIKDVLSETQRRGWRREIEKIGRWIYRNPVVGGYVFNLGFDLCALLWKIGHEFGHSDWCQWALEAADQRIQRDVDEEGWVHAEEGGSSGHYQLVGVNFIARFAWESKAEFLQKATLRIFQNSTWSYATPDLEWAANYGTRSSGFDHLPASLVLVAASLGDPIAAHFVRQYPGKLLEKRESYWHPREDQLLWREALKTVGTRPIYPAVHRFQGISLTVIREGPWVAHLSQYDRAIWTRGFINLWHEGHADWVFSTMHSLPKLPDSVRKKMRLEDIKERDWAGFPHVTINQGKEKFESHRQVHSIQANPDKNGTKVSWVESLLNLDGKPGGTLLSHYRFQDHQIEMELEFKDVSGTIRADFHFMRRSKGFVRLWNDGEMKEILAGKLLSTPGTYETRTLPLEEKTGAGIQLDRTIFYFEIGQIPKDAVITWVGDTEKGLHTTNLGGFRFRIEVPQPGSDCRIKLQLKALTP